MIFDLRNGMRMTRIKKIVFTILSCVVLGLFTASCLGLGWAHWKVEKDGKNANSKFGNFQVESLF